MARRRKPNRAGGVTAQDIADFNRPNRNPAPQVNRPGGGGVSAGGGETQTFNVGWRDAVRNALRNMGANEGMVSMFSSWEDFTRWQQSWGQVNWGQAAAPAAGGGDTGGGSGGGGGDSPPAGPVWNQQKEDAFQVMMSTWAAYGLDLGDISTAGSVASIVRDLIANDRHQIDGVVATAIRGSDAYRQRFPGMKDMIGRGWNEAQYIQQEEQYKGRLRNYFGPQSESMWGVNDYANWMTNNVSPEEVDRRMFAGHSWLTQSANAGVKQALKDMYGIGEDALLAYVLDPQRAEKLLMQQARAASIKGYGDKLGLSNQQAEALAQSESIMGIDSLSASGMGELASKMGQAEVLNESDSFLAAIEGDLTYNSADAVESAFGQADKALASQKRASRERSRFGGSSAVTAGSLARRRAQ